MMALIAAVFIASLLGSLHCAGMCGAFVAFAVGGVSEQGGGKLRLNAAYNGGRLVTYVLLGVAAGAVGALLDLGGAMAGLSRVAATLAGALMIGFGVVALLHASGKATMRWPVPGFLHQWMASGQRFAMTLSPVRRAAMIGLLTTLLPCGWLYAFAITAAGTASPLWGGVTMAVFWLGTLPVLVSLGVGVQKLLGVVGGKLPVITSLAVIAVGLWTLVGRAGIDVEGLMQRQAQSAHASEEKASRNVSNAEGQRAVDELHELIEQPPACCQDDEQ